MQYAMYDILYMHIYVYTYIYIYIYMYIIYIYIHGTVTDWNNRTNCDNGDDDANKALTMILSVITGVTII